MGAAGPTSGVAPCRVSGQQRWQVVRDQQLHLGASPKWGRRRVRAVLLPSTPSVHSCSGVSRACANHGVGVANRHAALSECFVHAVPALEAVLTVPTRGD